MQTLNVAIIGCGAIHSLHADAVMKCQMTNLAAVVDIDESRARESASKYGCSYYTDYREMLHDININSVHICTPHYLHAGMAIDAMLASKHVLTEKPMAISVSDAEKMIAVSEQTGKKLGVCFQNRYNTTSRMIKSILASGKAGKILGGKAFVTWHRDEAYYRSGSWRGTWDKEGGGVLINQSIHTLDLLQWFMGDIDSIKASVDTRLLENIIEVEDTAEATIKFKSRSTALFYATNCYPVDSPVEIELVCEKALLKLGDGLTIRYSDGETEYAIDSDKTTGAKAYWGCSHKALIEDFYSKLSSGDDIEVDGKQGINAIKAIDAIYRSHKTGKYVIYR